ncbi:MAG: phosphoglucosamine mutase [Desulfobacteraceae bacterium]|jgi:phosphoglucosamine mutase
MGRLFGTDGVRGVANTYPMDAETALSIGRAAARYFKTNQDDDQFIVIGQDTRLSGDMIAQAVGAGICSAGMNVSLVGILPTPAVAFLTHKMGAAAGVVISASHNPFADNGIKLFNSNGYKLDDQAEDEIEALMEQAAAPVAPNRTGRSLDNEDASEQYLSFLQNGFAELNLNGIKMVVDCSNGATYQVAPELFRRLGAKVIPIHAAPDGTNINADCGSQHPQDMARQVVRHQADLGLAFDGDGDRLVAADEKGNLLTGDQIIAICANHLKNKGKLKNNKVVTTIMSNMGFRLAMKTLGIGHFATQVGDRYVMQEMLAQDAILGGEDSGHMIFRDQHTTGDGILAAVRLLEALQAENAPLSTLSKVMKVFPQILINVDVLTKPDLNSIPEIMDAIKAAENQLGDQGRVLVRYSGTQAQCRVMVEGPTRDITYQLCQQIADAVRNSLAAE